MLYRALMERAREYPRKTAVAGAHGALTFEQLLKTVHGAALLFRELKLRAEEPVLLGVPPSPDFYAFFYGLCTVGATAVPVLPSGKIPRAIAGVRPALAIGESSFLAAAKAACPGIRATIEWNRKAGLSILSRPAVSWRRKSLIRGEKILTIATSGTTGEPELHFTTAETLLRHGDLRAGILGIAAEDVLLSTRPFNNLSSIDAPVILPLVTGCTVVVRETFQRFEAAETIARERVTVIYGVPIIFEMLASIPASHPANFDSLRLCVSGGAPLPRFVFDKFHKRFGIRIRQRYGGTQFFPAFNFDTRGVPGAVGQLTGPFPMSVVDESGKKTPPGIIGEIVLEFAKLKDPFWRSSLKTHAERRGKYIYTGDLGRIDSAGNLHIVGRKSPFIKVGGNRVAPAEVESVLRSHPKVRDTIVFPYRPGQRDEAVHAVVVPSGGLTPQELLSYCAEQLDPYKCPRRIDFRSRLPRNAQGKVAIYRFQSRRTAPAQRAPN